MGRGCRLLPRPLLASPSLGLPGGPLKSPLPLGWVPCVDTRKWGEEFENPRPCGQACLQRDWLSQSSRAWLAGERRA